MTLQVSTEGWDGLVQACVCVCWATITTRRMYTSIVPHAAFSSNVSHAAHSRLSSVERINDLLSCNLSTKQQRPLEQTQYGIARSQRNPGAHSAVRENTTQEK